MLTVNFISRCLGFDVQVTDGSHRRKQSRFRHRLSADIVRGSHPRGEVTVDPRFSGYLHLTMPAVLRDLLHLHDSR